MAEGTAARSPLAPGGAATVGGPARSALAGRTETLAAAGAREVVFLALLNLRLHPSLAARVPLALPLAPDTWTAGGGREALWLGPDEWLLVGAPGSAAATLAELEAALDGVHRSVVEVSANHAVVELAGGARLDLLAQGCGLDLHPRSWRAGGCVQTLLARVPVLLQERAGATRIFVRPSFAGYLADWLAAAARA